MKAETRDSSLKSSVGWMFIGQCSGYVLRGVYFVLIARTLGVVDYGAVAAAFAFVSLGAQYSRLGSGMVLLRYVSGERGKFSVYWGNVLVTTLVGSSIITAAFTLLAPHIIDHRSAILVAFTAAASCVFEQLTISATQVFQAFQRMSYTAGLNLITSLFRTLAAGGLLLTVHHATAMQWVTVSMIVSALASLVGVVAVTKNFGLPRFEMGLFRSRIVEGVEYTFAGSTNSVYDDLDKTMLSHYGMTSAVGIYAMAYRAIEIATVPITSIQLAAEPRQFALGPEGIEESAALGRRLMSKSVLMSLATAVVLFVAAPLLPKLVGPSFAESVSALRWLCLIPLFRSIHHLTGSVLTCSGRVRVRNTNQLVTALLNFLLNLWLIPRFGWQGAAGASLMSDGALGLMNWMTLRYVLGKRKRLREAGASSALQQRKPWVSIIIGFYKQEAYLKQTVESVKALTYPNVELIVVDDGSPVTAAEVLGDMPGVTIVRTENRGVAAARNYGVTLSRGEYLIFLDADDLLEPDAIEKHLAALDSAPAAVMSFGAVRLIDGEGRAISKPHVCRPRRNYLRPLLVSNPVACPGAAMISRMMFEHLGGFDERFLKCEDYMFYLRLAVRKQIVRQGQCVIAYRRHAQSGSTNKPAMLAATMDALDIIEKDLSPDDKKYLQHARWRWRHVYEDKRGVRYMLKELYCKVHAMLTVPLSAYFGHESPE